MIKRWHLVNECPNCFMDVNGSGEFNQHTDYEKLEQENARLREALEGLRKKHHYDCEDPWYSCATITCDKGRRDTACDCGMDALNEAIDKALQAQP